MNKLLSILVIMASIPFLVFGLIFLIAVATNPSRLLTAVALLLIGGLLLGWGVLSLRRLAEISPEALSTGIVDLARRLGGEVTVAQVQSEFRIPRAMALGALERLCGHGDCQREQRKDVDAYLFKGVMPAKAIKRCPYCGSEFAVKSALRDCPNCGANLEITKE
jgi:hypothetical protein